MNDEIMCGTMVPIREKYTNFQHLHLFCLPSATLGPSDVLGVHLVNGKARRMRGLVPGTRLVDTNSWGREPMNNN